MLAAKPAPYFNTVNGATMRSANVWVEADDDQFTCEVWRYHHLMKTIRCPTLQDVMRQVSDEFGWE